MLGFVISSMAIAVLFLSPPDIPFTFESPTIVSAHLVRFKSLIVDVILSFLSATVAVLGNRRVADMVSATQREDVNIEPTKISR